jgi:tRNA threonylcarbamoyl adenosine modification protein (Sua5/YciO/YrdC/YwlC family)
VPRRLSHPSRKTIGIRVPEHPVTLALLEVFGQPLISSTLQLPGDEIPLNDAAHIVERIGHELDVVIDGGACGVEPTTIVDVTGRQAVLVRRGRGPVEALGLQ